MRDIPDLTLSVIVPAHQGGEKLLRCLASLGDAAPPPDEIVVVVDGACEQARLLAAAHGARVIMLPTLKGPAHARNVGGAIARGNLLFFVDSDVVVPRNAIQQIVDVFQQESGLCALIGSYDDTPAETNFLSQYKNLLHHYVHQSSAETASTFWGACGVIRRDVFLAMAGFDESYVKPCVEDIELGYRLVAAGFAIRLCKSLQVKHLKRWDLSTLLSTDFYQRALPWTQLIWRDRRLINDLNLSRSSRLSTILVYIMLPVALATYWWPLFLVPTAFMIVSLLWLNSGLYHFFRRSRGTWFAFGAILYHWLYYFYSGLAFAIGSLAFLGRQWRHPVSLAAVRSSDY